jgi:hypothetical protein
MQNKVQPVSSSAVPAAERSEAERSETERSAAVGTAGADSTATVRPDPEVVAKAKRRKFTAKYKQEILARADAAASEPGAIGACCGTRVCTPRTWSSGGGIEKPTFNRDWSHESVVRNSREARWPMRTRSYSVKMSA